MKASRDENEAQNEDLSGSAISHKNYRILVMKKAIQLAKGKSPTTKNLWDAKVVVDKALGMSRRHIEIPGAAPGRRTI